MSNYIHKNIVIFILFAYTVVCIGICLVPFIGLFETVIISLTVLVNGCFIFRVIEKRKKDRVMFEIANEYLFWLIGWVVIDNVETYLDIAIKEITPISIGEFRQITSIPLPDTPIFINKLKLFQKYSRAFNKDFIYVITSEPFETCYPSNSDIALTVLFGSYICDQEIGCISVLHDIGKTFDNEAIFVSTYNPYIGNQQILKFKTKDKVSVFNKNDEKE